MSKRQPQFVSIGLKRLSICPCGHSVLDESIKLNTTYLVDLSTLRQPFTYICGGCQRKQLVTAVKASQVMNPDRPMAYLPYELFK